MPNYSLIVDATYDPMTYAEIAAPVKESAAYHDALMDKYDEMQMNSALFDRYIGSDDVKTRAMYDTYMKDLNNATNALMQRGAWGQRSTFSNARKSYSQNMMPIQLGYQKRAQEAAAQQQAKAKNPLLEFSHDATTSGLDWYLDNPNGGFQTIDPVVTAASVGQIAKSFAKMYKENPEGFYTTIRSLGVDSGFIESIQQKGGWNPEDILNYRKDPIMRAIMNTVLKGQGMAGFDDNGNPVGNQMWDAATVQRVGDFASQGLAEGVGGQVVTAQADPYEMAYAKAAASGSGSGSAGGAGTGSINESIIDMQGLPTNAKEAARVKGIAQNFGFSVGEDGTVTTGKAQTDMFVNGRLKTKDEFVKSSHKGFLVSDDRLRNSYDRYIRELQSLGIDTSKTVTKDMVQKALTTGYRNSMGTGYGMLALNMDISDLSNNLKNSSKLLRVSEPNASGKFGLAQKGHSSVKKLIEASEDAEVTISTSPGNEGIMFHTLNDGKDEYYLIRTGDITDRAVRTKLQRLASVVQQLKRSPNDPSIIEAINLLRDDLINSIGARNKVKARETNPDTNKD